MIFFFFVLFTLSTITMYYFFNRHKKQYMVHLSKRQMHNLTRYAYFVEQTSYHFAP